MILTIAAAIYKKHKDDIKKNDEIKELGHDGNFTLPDHIPPIPENTEAGQHWRIGVDPAAVGAVHHSEFGAVNSDAPDISSANVDELWEEVANMVQCPTPRASDLRRRPTIRSNTGRGMLQRSQTGKMSVMSATTTDSWTSKYSCDEFGRRLSDQEDGGLQLRWI